MAAPDREKRNARNPQGFAAGLGDVTHNIRRNGGEIGYMAVGRRSNYFHDGTRTKIQKNAPMVQGVNNNLY